MGDGTPLGAVRGLGSAKAGTHDWLGMQLSSIGLVVLGAWLTASLLMLPNLSFMTLRDWAGHTVPAGGLALLLVATVWHTRLGLTVVAEDYVHGAANLFAVKAFITLASYAGAAVGLIAIVRLAAGAGQ